jgi:hypothetical protein
VAKLFVTARDIAAGLPRSTFKNLKFKNLKFRNRGLPTGRMGCVNKCDGPGYVS